MSDGKILVVEDEKDIRDLIVYNLSREGYRVSAVDSGEEAFKLIKKELPELLLLDLLLPGMDGFDLTKKLKNTERTADIPIVILTAKGEEADIVTGLELGAEDYITKPFSPRILLARIKVILRRNRKAGFNQGSATIIRTASLEINPGKFEVLVDNNPVNLTRTEFLILGLLAGKPGWVFTRSQIVNAIYGEDYSITKRAVDVQIVGLRKKLGSSGKLVETVHGIGYRFREN